MIILLAYILYISTTESTQNLFELNIYIEWKKLVSCATQVHNYEIMKELNLI